MKRWWRVVLDAQGKVVSVRATDSRHEDPNVYYVRALNQDDAGRIAFNAYARVRLAARRKQYKAEGRCQCGRPRDAETLKCSACLKKERRYHERHAAKARGEEVPPLDRRTALRERRESEEADLRLRILREVAGVWQASTTNRAFTRWLEGEIAKLDKVRGAA